jgi:hypothetical protein
MNGGHEMEELRFAYCGLDCSECPVFIATLKNDNDLRRKTAGEWEQLYSDYIGKKALAVEDMNCQGCQSAGDIRFIGCVNCTIRKCSSGKSFGSCADCAGFAECEMLNGFFTSAPQAKENLNRIRASKK